METPKPSKDAVRNYMNQRREDPAPPPSPERIREMLGWGLVPHSEQNRTA